MADSNASLLSPSRGRPKAAALYQVGLARLQLGDVRGAYEDFKEAARIEPYNMEIWQKYEETYGRVEAEIAQEHAAESQAAKQRQQEVGREEYQIGSAVASPPPRFSFLATSDSAQQPLQLLADAVNTEAHDRALALQAGMLRGVLGGGRDVQQFGGNNGHGKGPGHAHGHSDHGRGRAMSKGEDREDGARYRSANVAVVEVRNPRLFFGVSVCWIAILCNSFIHYQHKLFHVTHGAEANTYLITAQVIVIGVGGLLFACLSWRCIKKSRVDMSLSDGIKLICIMVIAVCVFDFYVTRVPAAAAEPPVSVTSSNILTV